MTRTDPIDAAYADSHERRVADAAEFARRLGGDVHAAGLTDAAADPRYTYNPAMFDAGRTNADRDE